MPFARDTYTSAGEATYTITFPYLAEGHVNLFVDGVSKTFTFDNATTARPDVAVTSGQVVLITRTSNQTARLTDYVDASVFKADTLDDDLLQAFYIAQEALDESTLVLGLDSTGVFWDAESKSLINLVGVATTGYAVEYDQMVAFVAGVGGVTAPVDVTEDDFFLRATSAGNFTWQDFLIAMITDSGVKGRAVLAAATDAAAQQAMNTEVGVDVQAFDVNLDDVAAIVQAKGGLVVSDGTDYIAEAVGTNDFILVADSAQASGIKWAANAAASATTTSEGAVELATNAEVVTGTDTARVAPLSALNSHEGVCKGWLHYDQTAPSTLDSHNVTSVTDNAAGDFTVVWATDFGGADTCAIIGTGGFTNYMVAVKAAGYAAASTVMATTLTTDGSLVDRDDNSVVAVGTQ